MLNPRPIDLSLGLENTHVLVTGGSGAIGQVIVDAFLQAGAKVSVFELVLRHEKQSPSAIHVPAQLPTPTTSPPIMSTSPLSSSSRPATEPSPPPSLLDESPRPACDRFMEYRVDVSQPAQLSRGFALAAAHFGLIQVCVACAAQDLSYLAHHASLIDLPFAQWQQTFSVNVHGTFLTAQEWLRQVRDGADQHTKNLSLVVIGSESGRFGELGNADYASGKSAVQYGLVNSLVKDVVQIHPRARVNAVAPGPVDTEKFHEECALNPSQYYEDCQATTAMKRPTSIQGVARTILFLASENWSGDITGQVINVDGGKNGKLFWNI